ncbi:MAG: response regulator [Methylophaga sp.]|nr:response regulator [Methylophaga sp.]
MTQQYTILAVDDEPFNLEILEELLEDDYNLVTAENGQICLDTVKESNPDLILMDVNMPVLNGLETCQKLKEDFEVSNIPVIFVSALSTTEEKMAGYKAGGEDYITKPFNEDELLAKIDLTIKASAAIVEQEKNAAETMSMAMTAMSTAGDVGTALQFSNMSFLCKTADELVQALLDTYSAYGLMVTIRYVQGSDVKFYSHSEVIGDTEKQIIEAANDKGRFVDFGKRTLMNYERVSVLIKNMPIEDEMKYGRMKDNIGFLGDSTEARAKSLEVEVALNHLLTTTKELLMEVDYDYKDNEGKNDAILSHLHTEMEDAFQYLEMKVADEDRLVSILIEAEDKSKSLYSGGLKIEEKISRLMGDMSRFV